MFQFPYFNSETRKFTFQMFALSLKLFIGRCTEIQAKKNDQRIFFNAD